MVERDQQTKQKRSKALITVSSDSNLEPFELR